MDGEVVGVHEENVFEVGEEDSERFELVIGHCKICGCCGENLGQEKAFRIQFWENNFAHLRLVDVGGL